MKITVELDSNELDSPSFDALMKLIKEQSSFDLELKKPENEQQYDFVATELSLIKIFMDTFMTLYGTAEEKDVNKEELFNELIKTGKFDRALANKYLNVAWSSGLIYERRKDYYAKV